MLKNIKLFSTDSDRTTYESSASYETPYVSKVAADNSVHYNRPLRTISFTIGNVSYQALEGMTWQQWVDSSYNTDDYKVYTYTGNTYIVTSDLSEYIIDNSGSVLLSSLIISGSSYDKDYMNY